MSAAVTWGRHRENGVWIAPKSRWRFLFRGHDALYVAAGRLRVRLMKPARGPRPKPGIPV